MPSDFGSRVKALQNNLSTGTPCEKCGSIYYLLGQAYQYSLTDYTTKSVSISPQAVHVCLCGAIYVSQSARNQVTKPGERKDFFDSVDKAIAYRESQSNVNLNVVSIAEHEELVTKFNELSERFEALLAELSSADEEDVPEKTKKTKNVEQEAKI
jgi:hypothetical protein